MTIANYRIDRTTLGRDVHGIPTMIISLATRNEEHPALRFDMRSADFSVVLTMLEVAGVDAWEQLKNKFVRLKSDDEGMAIGHITEEIWFNLETKT